LKKNVRREGGGSRNARAALPPRDDERLILLDARDRETGMGRKLRVHREGL
jgi:hypothetical protein